MKNTILYSANGKTERNINRESERTVYSLDQKKLTTEAKVAPLSELSHLRDFQNQRKTFQKIENFREKNGETMKILQ